jgi:hypothetical protein
MDEVFTPLDILCHALNIAHREFVVANNECVRVQEAMAKLQAELITAQVFRDRKENALEEAKTNVLRAVGEPVDDDSYFRGLE